MFLMGVLSWTVYDSIANGRFEKGESGRGPFDEVETFMTA